MTTQPHDILPIVQLLNKAMPTQLITEDISDIVNSSSSSGIVMNDDQVQCPWSDVTTITAAIVNLESDNKSSSLGKQMKPSFQFLFMYDSITNISISL